jgi:hypothetical protein
MSSTRDAPTATEAYASHTRLRGVALVLTRTASYTVIALCVAVLFVSIPVYVSDLSLVCTRAPCPIWQLTTSNVAALDALGLSAPSYVSGTLILNCVAVLAWVGVAGLVVWRKSASWDGLLLATMLVLQGVMVANSVATPLYYRGGAWHEIIAVLSLAGPPLFLATFALFPDGRWAPRWMRWVFLLCCLASGAFLLTGASFTPDSLLAHASALSPATFYLVALASGVGAQIYKARVTLTARERQQVKWVLFGVFLGVGLFAALILPVMAFPRLVGKDSSYYLIIRPLATIILLSGPISFAIAVFRARLWDIDLIINRTLVYGCLTGILAAIYFGLVIGAQAVVQGLSGPRGAQPLIVVASTLLIAGLFQPLRRRLQRTIDRRFFRSKYDAHKTLAAFSATLQQEVSLLELQKRLVGVVTQTMQPTHVSLWLRPAPPAGAQELSEGGRQ